MTRYEVRFQDTIIRRPLMGLPTEVTVNGSKLIYAKDKELAEEMFNATYGRPNRKILYTTKKPK